MRILHITQGIQKELGGTTFAIAGYLRMEKNLGYESDVLTISGKDLDSPIHRLAKVIAFTASFPRRFSASKQAIDWLNQHGRAYDLVIIHGIWGILQVKSASVLRGQKIPYAIQPHGSLDPFDLRKKGTLKAMIGPRIIKQALQGAKSVICTAEREAKLLETYGANVAVSILSLPVQVSSNAGDGELFRKKYGIEKDDFLLLYLSRIDYKKGLDILIEALARVSGDHPATKLIIAGSSTGRYMEKVRKWVMNAQQSSRVIFTGFLDEKAKVDAFAASDCFVLPSLNENFGISIVESLAAGVPVLISENVYIADSIVREGGSWVCNSTVESLAQTLRHVLENSEDFKLKKDRAKIAAKQYSYEALAPQYRQFYESMTNNRDL